MTWTLKFGSQLAHLDPLNCQAMFRLAVGASSSCWALCEDHIDLVT